MRRKLRTKRGRERYKLRQTSIEPTYGYIKEELGLRQFLLRGQDKVRSIWRFTCAVHNILKLYRAEMRFAKAVQGRNRFDFMNKYKKLALISVFNVQMII